jgi:hypothetical protein
MGNNSSPQDCQTSEEAQTVADRFKALGGASMEDDGMTCAASNYNASRYWKNAVEYQERADELRKQGK